MKEKLIFRFKLQFYLIAKVLQQWRKASHKGTAF